VVSQKLGADFGNETNEQIYLAGLLHDIGILINALLLPEDFRIVMQEAVREHLPVSLVEQRIMGFTHAESGRIVAELWRLPVEVMEVIEYHHHPEDQKTSNELSVIVQVADRLCWNSELGYGYPVPEYESFSPEDTWRILSQKFPKANHFRCGDYAPVLESNLAAARELAEHVFGKTVAL
jgi:HD-like signal output (HDOD) protein